MTSIPRVSAVLAPPVINGKTVSAGKNVTFPEKRDGNEIAFPLKGGTLVIRTARKVAVQWNPWHVEVRILCTRGSGRIRDTQLEMHLIHRSGNSIPLDLRKVVNMGFRDSQAEDRRGGWTDQGEMNDLRPMKPGRQELAGILFDVIDPETNGGRSSLAMRGPMRPYFAERAAVAVPNAAGRFLYVLNGLAWPPAKGVPCGEIRIGYSDGSSSAYVLRSGIDTANFWGAADLAETKVFWRGTNSSSGIGLFGTKIPLSSGKRVRSVEFLSRNQVWMIVAASIADREPVFERNESITLKAGKEWVRLPFSFGALPGSAADLSGLLDPPAGKHGFLQIRNGRFVFENAPGKPVRFWGGNLCGESLFMEERKTLAMLDELASMGYNTIRLHHFDRILTAGEEKTGQFDPEKLRRLDFLVAEAKKRGIYTTLDLFTFCHAGNQAKHGIRNVNDYKNLCYFDPQVRAGLVEFARKLLTHVNLRTGRRWCDDPAVITLNLINEGTLRTDLDSLPERVRNAAYKAYAAYASARGMDSSGKPSGKELGEFIEYTGREFFADLKKRLGDFGVKIPLSDQNYASPVLNVRDAYDYIDVHFYWNHPSFIGKRRWSLPTYTNPTSAVKAWAGGIGGVFHHRRFDRPMTISEWGYCYPSPYHIEGAFLTAAYAAFQDYSGLWQFAYSHSGKVGKAHSLGAFDYHSHPVQKFAARAGSLLYLRGDVGRARRSVAATRESAPLLRRVGLIAGIGIEETPSGRNAFVVGRTETKSAAPSGVPVLRAEDGDVFLKRLAGKGVIAPDACDPRTGVYRSDTGELELNVRKGSFRVVTPRTEVFLLPAGESLAGRFMKGKSRSAFAVVAASSLDGKVLAESGRILILHLTDVKSENAVFRDSGMSILEQYGSGNLLLRRNRAEISLNLSGEYVLYACAGNGKRLSEQSLPAPGGECSFTADNADGVILYELIRKQ